MASSTEARRYQNRIAAIRVAALAVIALTFGYPTRWWTWAIAAAAAAAFTGAVVKTSRDWMDALERDVTEIDGATMPDGLEATRSELSRVGFEYKSAFSSDGDSIALVMRSRDGTVAARAIAYGGGTGYTLVTRWPGGQSLATGDLGISLAPDEHLQLLPGLDLQQRAAAHSAGVGILSRAYGTPSAPDLTVAAMNDATKSRLVRYRRRRYRRTAQALVANYGGRYSRPIATQLGIDVSAWLIWAMAVTLGAALALTWWWAVADGSSSAYRVGISATALFGGLIAYSLIHMRRRQRFLP